ncbi:putative HVA22-like protein g [Chenopodium quinoa]|uniref:putative HVA22-like protein g n=1 Tax=Chenopodium quinoa TaxID=63459 RepID=UPI000B796896|nr:putative HVA22-like protein g [Chenopodium quinoa]
MIGHFLTRGLVMIFGYAYPAYECYKTVEKNKPEIEQLRFWCQYWILVALMTVFERVSDTFISWLPMYSEAKLAFIIYLWYPRTKGTTYVYDSFFKPYVSKHETEIDRNLLELRIRAGDMTYTYCQKAMSYGQTRIFEILQYVAAQSTPNRRPTQPQQPQQPAPRPRPSPPAVNGTAAPRQPSTKPQTTTQKQDEEPMSPTSSTSSSQDNEMEEELSSAKEPSSSASAPAPAAAAPPSPSSTSIKKSVSLPSAPESRSSQPASNIVDVKLIESAPTKVVKSPIKPSGAKSLPTPEETVMEEAIRVTRGRLRKTKSTTANK